MSALSRSLMAAAVVLGTVFVLVRLEVAGADWDRCFHGLYRELGMWPSMVRLLTDPEEAKLMLIFAAPVVPALLVVALARRWVLPILAIAPLAVLIASVALVEVGAMHDCDRKGPDAGAFVWMFLIQLPISALLLIALGVRRLIETLRPADRGGSAQAWLGRASAKTQHVKGDAR
jgi:hypothetical protein